jgi:hypothetical protein
MTMYCIFKEALYVADNKYAMSVFTCKVNLLYFIGMNLFRSRFFLLKLAVKNYLIYVD